MPMPACPIRSALLSRAPTPAKPWLARLTRDVALWLRAPAGNRPDWGTR
ncbi:hypothetical protein [Roseomonas populi]|uniref:Uncharacterized protein n=1 Tax=Roseomonas populi TaxID=3121582 RepID=A0ABT1X5R2_9PROT|nr:hypothetical protein [Roseomonas pecuniae]MCR0983429.1 hypothetical protein [Roseomonas pecuniae]